MLAESLGNNRQAITAGLCLCMLVLALDKEEPLAMRLYLDTQVYIGAKPNNMEPQGVEMGLGSGCPIE